MEADAAHAKARGKAIPSFGPELIAAAMESGAAAAPPQFFTINEVLAQKAEEAAKAKTVIRLASLEPIALRGTIDKSPATRVTAADSEPFGLLSFRAPEGLLWVKWRSLQTEIQRDREALEHCRSEAEHCPPGARKFGAIVEEARVLGGPKRLEYVNSAVNSAIRYTSDFQQHGVADLWSTPLATFATDAATVRIMRLQSTWPCSRPGCRQVIFESSWSDTLASARHTPCSLPEPEMTGSCSIIFAPRWWKTRRS